MAKIARTTYTETFASLSNESAELRETNDCFVKAVTLLTGLPYRTVHAAMAKHGRQARRGTSFATARAACATLGFRLVQLPFAKQREIIAQYPGAHKNLQSITTHHPRRFAKVWAEQPPMIFHVAAHVAAFKDGVIHDWSVNSAKRVIGLYTVEKMA